MDRTLIALEQRVGKLEELVTALQKKLKMAPADADAGAAEKKTS